MQFPPQPLDLFLNALCAQYFLRATLKLSSVASFCAVRWSGKTRPDLPLCPSIPTQGGGTCSRFEKADQDAAGELRGRVPLPSPSQERRHREEGVKLASVVLLGQQGSACVLPSHSLCSSTSVFQTTRTMQWSSSNTDTHTHTQHVTHCSFFPLLATTQDWCDEGRRRL